MITKYTKDHLYGTTYKLYYMKFMELEFIIIHVMSSMQNKQQGATTFI